MTILWLISSLGEGLLIITRYQKITKSFSLLVYQSNKIHDKSNTGIIVALSFFIDCFYFLWGHLLMIVIQGGFLVNLNLLNIAIVHGTLSLCCEFWINYILPLKDFTNLFEDVWYEVPMVPTTPWIFYPIGFINSVNFSFIAEALSLKPFHFSWVDSLKDYLLVRSTFFSKAILIYLDLFSTALPIFPKKLPIFLPIFVVLVYVIITSFSAKF